MVERACPALKLAGSVVNTSADGLPAVMLNELLVAPLYAVAVAVSV